MKMVFTSRDAAAMGIVQTLLSREGFETTVLNEHTAAALGEIPFLSAMPELWVLRDKDVPGAKAVVERFESGELRDEVRSEPWDCPACGQQIEGQFTECWKCVELDPREQEDSRCLECGYLLRSLPERRCPECGKEF